MDGNQMLLGQRDDWARQHRPPPRAVPRPATAAGKPDGLQLGDRL